MADATQNTGEQSLLDSIASEVANLSDEEIAAAAAQIQARRQKATGNVTPERKAAMKERERRRRLQHSAILKLAKEKGLVPKTARDLAREAAAVPATGASA